jgi:hypothetical protein
MRIAPQSLLCCCIALFSLGASAQIASPAATSTPTSQAATSVSPEMSSDLTAYTQMLDQLQQTAQQTAGDLGRMKIDKWKVDSATKQQSQANTTSLQRNLTAAMPEIIQKAQAAPQDLGPSFTVYRTLSVVYDVLSATAENAGAFGPKEQYDPIARDIAALDQLRRGMADRLAWLAGVKDTQILQLRQQLATAQQQAKTAAATPAPTAPPKKKTTKKK